MSHMGAWYNRASGSRIRHLVVWLFGLGSLGDLDVLVLSEISRVKDWLWLRKVLALILHFT